MGDDTASVGNDAEINELIENLRKTIKNGREVGLNTVVVALNFGDDDGIDEIVGNVGKAVREVLEKCRGTAEDFGGAQLDVVQGYASEAAPEGSLGDRVGGIGGGKDEDTVLEDRHAGVEAKHDDVEGQQGQVEDDEWDDCDVGRS